MVFIFYFMREEFIQAVKNNQDAFGIKLADSTLAVLADYYELVMRNNELLHLVAPSTSEEFAIRHILESLTLLEHLPKNAKFADVGTGAGLPGIPCVIVRNDLKVFLIESKPKKSNFLNHVREKLRLQKQMTVIGRQFEEFNRPDVRTVTCRAIDKFTQKLPALVKWSAGAYMVFFGGENLREELRAQNLVFREKLLPLSEKRFLFQIKKNKI